MCLILGAGFIAVGMTAELIVLNSFDERGALRDDWIVDNDSLRVSQLISSLMVVSKVHTGLGSDEKSRISLQHLDGSDSSVIDVELSITDQITAKQPSDASPLLEVNLHGLFAMGNRRLVANFTIPTSGDIAILKGSSGIGKSVLLKEIAMMNSGLIPSSTSSISLSGRNREDFHPSEWRRRVLYLPQQGSSMLQGTPHSFLHFIDSSLNHKHAIQSPTVESVTTLTTNYIEAWGVQSSKLSQPWAKLSGGESQRVLLAIALSTRPHLILLDESTSALDLESKLKVEESLKKSAENGCAMVLITHDEEQISRLGTVNLSLNAVS